MKLSEIVKGTTAYFNCYRDGELWYKVVKQTGVEEKVDIECRTTYEFPKYETIYEFPVPIADTGTGIFDSEMKPITLMRWIRKHLDKQAKWQAERDFLLSPEGRAKTRAEDIEETREAYEHMLNPANQKKILEKLGGCSPNRTMGHFGPQPDEHIARNIIRREDKDRQG